MNFIRNTPSLPRRRLLSIIAATVVGGALSPAIRPGETAARADVDEDGRGDQVVTDSDHDHRVD